MPATYSSFAPLEMAAEVPLGPSAQGDIWPIVWALLLLVVVKDRPYMYAHKFTAEGADWWRCYWNNEQ